MKYYSTSNSSILICGVQFERYAIIGGSSFGVYATSDKELIAKLDELVNAGKLSTLTEPEYARCLKKKPTEFAGFIISPQPTENPNPLKSQPVKLAVKAEPESAPEPVIVTPLASTDVVQVAQITAPTSVPEPKAETVAEPQIPSVPTPRKKQ